MEMALPKRWARRFSVGALVHSAAHVAEAFSCPEKRARLETVVPQAAERCAAALRAL